MMFSLITRGSVAGRVKVKTAIAPAVEEERPLGLNRRRGCIESFRFGLLFPFLLVPFPWCNVRYGSFSRA
jgi:hypothetical protein